MWTMVLVLIGSLSAGSVNCAGCACATTSVNVRSGAGTAHSVLITLQSDFCLSFKGGRQTVNGDEWVNVDQNGQDGWIHGSYVTTSPNPCACATTNVNVRNGAGSTNSQLTTLQSGICLTFKGYRQDVNGASWVNVNYISQDGWIHENYVTTQNMCACATTNVNVRDGAGLTNSILITLQTDLCLTFKGYSQVVNGASWLNVNCNGQDGWIHVNYVAISACPGNDGVQLLGCPKIVTRAEWGARDPSNTPTELDLPVDYMFIHHGASSPCYTEAVCEQSLRSYQNHHMDTNGWDDIGYSFVVGEDGRVYEGRGWDAVGAHTSGYNNLGLAICVVGNFQNIEPNAIAQEATKQLIACGEFNGKLSSSYTLLGHRDVKNTNCPGNSFYSLIQGWPHYSSQP